ncbi:hypothetical protein [Streptomyces sp. NPDC058155]|uniref:hypothetical protein n=1 Tax=Streptomyces sp. NPDC058155 TaxID=3346359 RepID=UPI0036E3BEA1
MDDPPSRAVLSDEQKIRVEFARSDLDKARRADLAAMSSPALILSVERLRQRLDDMLTLIEETQDPLG